MTSEIQLFDSHAHIDLENFDKDRSAVIERWKAAGVSKVLNILMGPDVPQLQAAINTLADVLGVYFSVGIHPHDADKMKADTLENMRPLFEHPKVCCVGEIGLDYYYNNAPRKAQTECFEAWVQFALDEKLPITVHSRDAHEDTVAILKDFDIASHQDVIIHCFTGDAEQAQSYLDLGAFLSFSGIVTFKRATDIQAAARLCPLDRMLIETDSPFLAPTPYRGKRNEPAYVLELAKYLALEKGIELEVLAERTHHNACRILNIT